MNIQDGINLGEALFITLFSMGIVFLTLIIISLILGGFKSIFYKDDSTKTSVKKAAPPIGDNVKEETLEVNEKESDNDEEIVAVIAAAIAAHTGNTVENISIKNIVRIPQNSPTWMRAGRERSVFNKVTK
ncbi:OadG family transporter subunit [Senegalia sp. (in: firmicutes)]|uniref:OadG family transporter subunit n=1 Tax=Senegalia sp. (in: firmicutes) TaxID=1924098 RepID=UPI003F9C9290